MACATCAGPRPEDCTNCHNHAYRNEFGFCQCSQDWADSDCATYVGQCDNRCFSCTGPTNSECDGCAGTAQATGATTCECLDKFTGSNCLLWKGDCDPICKGCYAREPTLGLSGLSTSDCFKCVFNAHWVQPDSDSPAYCACDEHWTGADCSEFVEDYCYSTCVTCTGPLQEDCLDCAANGYRNSEGYCVCMPGWEKHNCSQWAGACDPRCLGCIGPSNTDCISCVGNADNDGGACVCQDDWRGPACDKFAGECHANCHGCHGPLDSNCQACVKHAYEDSNGQCVCDPTWGPEVGCTRPIPPCGIYCDKCEYNSSNELSQCTLCIEGYYLHNHSCHQCHASCLTCSNPTSCDLCHEGWAANNGSCEPCHSNCATCSLPNDPSSCNSCEEPIKTLSDGSSSYCVCRSSYADKWTYECHTLCAQTLTADANSICTVEGTSYNAIFSELQSNGGISSDFSSERWPSLHEHRGAYFDNSWVEWHAFRVTGQFFMEIWFRPDWVNNAVIMNFDFEKVPATAGTVSRGHDDWFWLFDNCYGFPDGITVTWHALAISLLYGDTSGAFEAHEQIKMDEVVIFVGNREVNAAFHMQ